MPLEPTETYELLLSLHLPSLTPEENSVLAAVVAGWRSSEIASRMFRSDRDVRRIVERLAETVCRPAGAHHSLALLGLWFACTSLASTDAQKHPTGCCGTAPFSRPSLRPRGSVRSAGLAARLNS